MGHDKHAQPASTAPVKDQGGNEPGGKPQDPAQGGGLTDPGVPVHQVKPAQPLPVGQEGAVSLRFVVLAQGVQVYGQLEGTGGASVDLGIHQALTVS